MGHAQVALNDTGKPGTSLADLGPVRLVPSGHLSRRAVLGMKRFLLLGALSAAALCAPMAWAEDGSGQSSAPTALPDTPRLSDLRTRKSAGIGPPGEPASLTSGGLTGAGAGCLAGAAGYTNQERKATQDTRDLVDGLVAVLSETRSKDTCTRRLPGR